MATMNISLPDDMKAWVEAKAANGSYANVSDYMRDMIRKEQARAAFIKEIEEAAEEAYASGFSEVDLDELYEEITGSKDQ